MRVGMVLGMAGLMITGALPVMAQSQPVYVSPTTTPSYYASDTGAVPYYNNSAKPLAMEQMVAGKNAPSYNYNTTSPYNFGASTYSNSGALTSENMDRYRAERDAQAQLYQQQYLQQAQQAQQQAQAGLLPYQANGYGGLMPQEEKPRPTKKRLVYNERDNPLSAPPRLFNPDQ